jgi:ferredoxin
MQVHQRGTPMLASSGYNMAAVDADLARVDGSACMGCGVCVAHCPQVAISLVRGSAKGEPLVIRELIARAASIVGS